MKKTLLIVNIFSCFYFTQAQMGVGTSNPRNSFHVDGGKNNDTNGDPTITQQQDDVIITSQGQIGVGITTPSTKLHINSTSSPAVRIVDGTEGAGKILTSDTNGNGSWISSPATKPTVGGVLPATTPNIVGGNTTWIYLNASITLPPGNWLVQMGTALLKADSNAAITWIHFSLSDSQSVFNYSPNIDNTRSGRQMAGATAPAGGSLTFASGVLAINNTSGADKTYYLWSRNAGGNATVNSPISSTLDERYFYAIPVN